MSHSIDGPTPHDETGIIPRDRESFEAPFVPDDPVLVISCDTCIMQNTEACSDCMMNALCGNDHGAVILSLQELREVRMLARAGLVPTLRHRAVG